MLRHSKAMHLLENGVNLIYIRDILGHASVVTTEVYAKANPEMKRQAIEAAAAHDPRTQPVRPGLPAGPAHLAPPSNLSPLLCEETRGHPRPHQRKHRHLHITEGFTSDELCEASHNSSMQTTGRAGS